MKIALRPLMSCGFNGLGKNLLWPVMSSRAGRRLLSSIDFFGFKILRNKRRIAQSVSP